MIHFTGHRHIHRLCMSIVMYALAYAFMQAQKIEGDSCIVTPLSYASATETAKSRPLFLAAKTNMLYDIMAVPNIGFEAYVGHDITVSAQWMYAWWSKASRSRYFRIYGGEIAGRYWFGKSSAEKPLTGHHAGIYVSAFTFDFQWGGTAYLGGRPGHSLWDRCMMSAGIEYGYSLPVAKHLNVDFSVGIGYVGGIVEKYKPVNDDLYTKKSVSRITWFGPTKAEISLVWLIGRDNVNARKGGSK